VGRRGRGKSKAFCVSVPFLNNNSNYKLTQDPSRRPDRSP
jgi:hypothetical protein